MATTTYAYSCYALAIPVEYEKEFIANYQSYHHSDTDIQTFADLYYNDCSLNGLDTVLFAADEFYPEMFSLDKISRQMTNNVLENALIVPLKRQPQLFEQVYNSEIEIVQELKQSIGKYLPVNFPYQDYLGCYSEVKTG